MTSRRKTVLVLVLILAGLGGVAVAQRSLNDYVLSLVNFVGIYIILAVSLNITNGFTGLFSLGHPAFMAVGGYTAAILTFPVQRKAYFLAGLPEWLSRTEVSFLPSLLMGGIMASLAALVVGVPVLRLRGHYLAVATLGVLIIVQVLITNLESVTRGPLGLNGLPALTTLWWVFPWVVVTLIVSWKIKFSSFGRTMLSVREDDLAAECCGVNLFRTRVAALVIGAFFAGVAGGLWAHLVTAITPKSFSLVLAFTIVVMVVVGGAGSITGSVVAAIIFSVLTEFFRPLEERLNLYGLGEIFVAMVMIFILIHRPTGILGTREPRLLRPEDS